MDMNIDSAYPSWKEVRRQIFSPKEIAESDLRVAMIGKFNKAKENNVKIKEDN